MSDAHGGGPAAGDHQPADMTPAVFATLVREATDEQLAAGLAANREPLLTEIFRRMPESFDAERAADVDAVVEWRILTEPSQGATGYDAWHLVLRDGVCQVAPGPAADPTVVYEIGPIDFLRLISGTASGPKLFLFGRLKIRGNLLLAARMPAFFRVPRPSD